MNHAPSRWTRREDGTVRVRLTLPARDADLIEDYAALYQLTVVEALFRALRKGLQS